MLVLEDAPIVISAEGFRNLLFGVFVVYLKPVSKGVVVLCSFQLFHSNPDMFGSSLAAVLGEYAEHSHLAETFSAPRKRIP